MKKLLGGIAAVTLVASPVLTNIKMVDILNKQKDVKINNSEMKIESYFIAESWNIVSPHKSINLSVGTPKTGTHSKHDSASVSTTAQRSYDQLKAMTNINISGEFKFGTNKEPVTHQNIALNQDLTVNKDEKLKFWYKYSHDKWRGWGHQTSEIAITITITKSLMGMATIQIDNYVFARTAGSSSVCSTKSTIDKIDLIL